MNDSRLNGPGRIRIEVQLVLSLQSRDKRRLDRTNIRDPTTKLLDLLGLKLSVPESVDEGPQHALLISSY